ncbi:hypothetical protein [Candidatus Protochlamydia naegleriophila]|uniref:hypothetical protein n=1 Tax=Candidatus Protochlamydia naegleriophila TaxID=389348 RepID=UPI000AE6B801|nr:hypothetical protein [Candidatus Protochlamydia naegleriophila]
MIPSIHSKCLLTIQAGKPVIGFNKRLPEPDKNLVNACRQEDSCQSFTNFFSITF